MSNKPTWKGNYGPKQAAVWLNEEGEKLGKDFQTEVSRLSKKVQEQIQFKINMESAGGVVNYTSKATAMKTYVNTNSVKNRISVLPNQGRYLKHIIDPDYAGQEEGKIIPFSSAKLTAQGNISRLKANLGNGKYHRQRGKNGRTYIIDTTKSKKKSTRALAVIGVYADKKRNQLFNFYDVALSGAITEFSRIKGSFQFKKQ
ncbi:hypothetical protein FG446_003764 [Yersinia enterocolitica]|nr:hypothetical protein [Yersinia enterocolitica]